MASDSQKLLDGIVRATEPLVRTTSDIQRAVDAAEPGIKRAAAIVDGPTSQVLAAALELQQERIEQALEQVRQILRDLATLSSDKPFVAARLADVRLAAANVSGLRDDLTFLAHRTDMLLETAERTRERSLKSAANAQRGLAQLRMWLRGDESTVKAAQAKAEPIAAAVLRAVEERDQAALDAQQRAFDAMPIELSTLPDANRKRIRDWAVHTIGQGLGAEVDRELSSEVRGLLAKVDAFERQTVDPYEKLRARAMSALIPDIDAGRAARALEIADALLARKLAAAIRDVPTRDLERSLEAFRKANKLAGSGREMAAALRRERVFR